MRPQVILVASSKLRLIIIISMNLFTRDGFYFLEKKDRISMLQSFIPSSGLRTHITKWTETVKTDCSLIN